MSNNNYPYEWKIKDLDSEIELNDLLEDHKAELTSFEWNLIFKLPFFKLKMIEGCEDKVDWEYLCSYIDLPLDFMKDHLKYLNWYEVSLFQHLDKEFINKYKAKLSLDVLPNNIYMNTEMKMYAKKLYEKNKNDKELKKVWDINLRNSKIFCPYELRKTKKKSHKNKTVIKTTVEPTKKSYEEMTKAELTKILVDNNIRVYYHDTMPILIEKCKGLKL
jgi:hypothetical protein